MKKTLLVLAVCAATLFGGQGDYKSELTATVGGVMPEGNLDLEDELNLGLRFGVYVEDKFFDMIEAGFERASNVDYDNSNMKTDINRLYVNLVKEYDLSKDLALYGLAGIGFENYRNPQFENEDDGYVQYGAGLKYWITDEFAMKAEVKHGINFSGDNNLFYSLGFVVPFGKKAQEAPVQSTPAVVSPQDDDNDGVSNENDKCPNTLAGVAVDANGCAMDDDKDGVINEKDKCPNTLAGVSVDTNGCAMDDDKDGVINADDKCLATPMGRVVDTEGCSVVVSLHVNFDYDEAVVPSSYKGKLNDTVEFMNENKNYKVSLEGHTDSKGSEKYNQTLSEKRAAAVAKALHELGVDESRISTIGYGETKPVASNDTEEGRAKNRRVDALFNK